MNPEGATALVLSAGFSERMGEFKPLMTLGGMTLLERVIRLFQSAGVNRIHVVVGHRAIELTPLIQRLGGHCVLNVRYADGMFSSVAAGVASLDERTESFFVMPVDIPLVRAATIRILISTFRPGTTVICHPIFLGRRGHPTLIDRRFIKTITDWRGNGGLKALLDRFESEALDVPVADEFILQDMDSPDDYQRMQRCLKTYAVLSSAECHALLVERLKVPASVWAHGRAVAEQALYIGRALVAAGCRLNLDLIYATALVHDMARGEPGHARQGGRILRELNMPQMAEIVETHMDLSIEKTDPICEAEVVFLSDKLICEDRFVGIDARFLQRLNDHRTEPEIQASIRSRLKSVYRSAERIESITGRPLASLDYTRRIDESLR